MHWLRALVVASVLTITVACHRDAEPAAASGLDAAASPTDAGEDAPGRPLPAEPPPASRPTLSCDGGVAAEGGTCDSSRLVLFLDTRQAGCFGIGQFCDDLLVIVSPEEQPSVPEGFVCDPPDHGYVVCRWPRPKDRLVDEAAMGASCRATAALPNVVVRCNVYL